jgi:hypothetical protein
LLINPKLYYGSNILFLIGLGLSKASVAALLLRLCVDKMQKRYCIGSLAFVGLWLLASIFVIAFQCNLSHPWILLEEKCDDVVSTSPRKSAHTNTILMMHSYCDGKSSEGWTFCGKSFSLRWLSLWSGVYRHRFSPKYKWYCRFCTGFRKYTKALFGNMRTTTLTPSQTFRYDRFPPTHISSVSAHRGPIIRACSIRCLDAG